MNAVNLIPRDARTRRTAAPAGPATLGLVGGLVLVLVAVVLYVSASNDVTSRRDTLTRLSAATSSWTAAAGQFAPFVKAAQEHAQQVAGVRQLAAARFPWSQLLSQIGSVMPAGTGLTSMQASTASSSSTSTAGSSPATAASVPAVQLSGCAQDQSTVAQTMVALHEVTGVTDVTLSSSTSNGSTDSAASSSSTSGGSGGCQYPVQFAITLTFGGTSATTSGAATTPSTGATTSTTSTVASATSTPSSSATTAAAAPATSGSTASTDSAQ